MIRISEGAAEIQLWGEPAAKGTHFTKALTQQAQPNTAVTSSFTADHSQTQLKGTSNIVSPPQYNSVNQNSGPGPNFSQNLSSPNNTSFHTGEAALLERADSFGPNYETFVQGGMSGQTASTPTEIEVIAPPAPPLVYTDPQPASATLPSPPVPTSGPPTQKPAEPVPVRPTPPVPTVPPGIAQLPIRTVFSRNEASLEGLGPIGPTPQWDEPAAQLYQNFTSLMRRLFLNRYN